MSTYLEVFRQIEEKSEDESRGEKVLLLGMRFQGKADDEEPLKSHWGNEKKERNYNSNIGGRIKPELGLGTLESSRKTSSRGCLLGLSMRDQ